MSSGRTRFANSKTGVTDTEPSDQWHRGKNVSTVRGLARTYLAGLIDKIPSFGSTTHSSMLPWTVGHAAWVLTCFHVRGDTQMTLYEKIRGKKYRKEILPLGEQVLALRQEPMSISFCSHGSQAFGWT